MIKDYKLSTDEAEYISLMLIFYLLHNSETISIFTNLLIITEKIGIQEIFIKHLNEYTSFKIKNNPIIKTGG